MDARIALGAALAAVAAAALLGSACGGADFDRRLPAAAGGELTVDIELGSGFSFDRGSLEVASHSADDVRVLAEVSGWGEYAVDIDVREVGGDVRVVGRVDGFLHWAFGGPTVDMRVLVPASYRVDARIDRGPLRLEDLEGPITARVAGSEVALRRATGDVELSVSGGNVSVEDVEGSLAIEAEGGEVEIAGVHGDLSVRSETGSVEIASVKGRVDVTAKRGSIEVERVRGDVRARSGRGRIELEDIEGDVELLIDRGSIEVEDLEGRIHARSRRGDIEVEFGSEPVGVIETASGSIEIEVPRDARFRLDAATERGSVELDDEIAFAVAAPPDVAAGPAPAHWERIGPEIAREVQEKVVRRVRENLDQGLREGNWGELDWDWEFDWSWEERDGSWDGDRSPGDSSEPSRDDFWGHPDRLWSRARAGRGQQLEGAINGGGPDLVLRAGRGEIRIEER